MAEVFTALAALPTLAATLAGQGLSRRCMACVGIGCCRNHPDGWLTRTSTSRCRHCLRPPCGEAEEIIMKWAEDNGEEMKPGALQRQGDVV